jgi:hypothetical protein
MYLQYTSSATFVPSLFAIITGKLVPLAAIALLGRLYQIAYGFNFFGFCNNNLFADQQNRP